MSYADHARMSYAEPERASFADPERTRGPSASFLDVFEKLSILVLYIWLVARVATSVSDGGKLLNGFVLVSEGLVLLFLVARRPTTDLSRRPIDWVLAIAATCGPLLVSPTAASSLVPPALAGALWLAGTLFQLAAKVALGRSIGCVPAHRGLKRGGPYKLVRHPMYAGYLLGHLAFLLMNPSLANLAVYALCEAIQVPRILSEERLLGRDPAYRLYCGEVRWRVIPGLF